MVRVQTDHWELEKQRCQGQGKRMGVRSVLHTPSDAASSLTTEAQGSVIFIGCLMNWPGKVKQLIQHHTAHN